MALLLEKEEEHNFSITYHLTFWDIFRVLEEKYKTLLQKLCMEMLKEHYGSSMWDSMSVVQQEEKLEELYVLAEDALENNDFLSMSNLPGAFKHYRSANGLMLRNCLEENISDSGLEWTAVYNLWELYKNYKLEKTYTLKKIIHSNKSDLQEPESMVFSLYMNAIYMKVKRERHFLPAFLVAYPCLEKWSDVISPDQEQLARWWIEKGIQSDGVKQFKKLEGHTKQETAVECLLLRQEWERCYFIRLLHNLSLEDFNENQEISPSLNADLSSFSDDLLELTSVLRVATARKLWQVKSSFQLKVTWGDCAVCLLTELIQHQERELRSAVMILVSKNEENCFVLQDQYESELKEKRSDHLIWLLFSHQMKHALVIQTTDNAQAHEECFTEEDANVKTGNKPEVHSEISAVEEGTHQIILTQQEENEICSACGNALTANEIPYLEVMGAEDMTEEYSKLDEICVEGNISGHIPNYEKQGSLIASAWSKDTEDIRHGDYTDTKLSDHFQT
ncbi:uncharacterized protein LOC120534572 [Polypterus senegalus]|uniref:uncharacterized protein LOC120534572 n=1 Tax=Polypterus senegalus TaxID=55291 RepID=UPI0019641F59|nr:uncharacterized protein LOC120534572 [Polypterus senegalus]